MYTLREWQKTVKPIEDYIFNASETTGGDLWVPFTIGVCAWYYPYKSYYSQTQIGGHTETVQCHVSTNTDGTRRKEEKINRPFIIDTLKTNKIYNTLVYTGAYYLGFPTYKFVISPEGNGIDCHRHYEALMAGCIPIIEENELIKDKYKGCPILWTKDYSEITIDYLEEKYLEMIDKTYDFSCLLLSKQTIEHQEEIKKNGNYWCNKHLGKVWY